MFTPAAHYIAGPASGTYGDQFEDHLDNGCIYELVIPRLVDIKQSRQVILVTHNPNIVVAGQADWSYHMALSTAREGCRCRGRLDQEEGAQEIMSTLEGGREAFCCRLEYLGLG